jgi:hypothetical protein
MASCVQIIIDLSCLPENRLKKIIQRKLVNLKNSSKDNLNRLVPVWAIQDNQSRQQLDTPDNFPGLR